MDSEEFRAILSRSSVGIWEMIEAAIRVASSDYSEELRRRRAGIVESLYAPAGKLCTRCGSGSGRNGDVEEDHRRRLNNRSNIIDNNNTDVDEFDDRIDHDEEKSDRNLNEDFGGSPVHQNLSGGEEEGEDLDPLGGLFDDDEDEQTKILGIKEQLEDPHQSENDVVELLQNLADMDITFQALKDTDIGRHVNRLRKHSSNEVRRLVKHLVRKWKETVDEWVKVHEPQGTSNLIADVDSPQQNMPKNQQNGHHQVPDFGFSPNPRNGNSSAERNYAEPETKPKPFQSVPRREPPSRQPQSVPKSASATPPNRTQKESVADDERLDSARKRLQQNYQDAQNAKKQRTIQVMDINDIPKPKKAFFPKKGGFHGRFNR